MKLSSFLAGCFGIVGFVLAILAGLYANNEFGAIIGRALVGMVLCYAVGYGVGLIAQHVAREHAQVIAQVTADEDAKAAVERQAAADKTAADKAAADAAAGAVPAAAAPPA